MCNHPDERLITGIFAHPAYPHTDHDGSPEEEEEPSTPTWPDTLELARVWASTMTHLSHHLDPLPLVRAWILQTVGQVFLALSHEESAFAHYILVSNRLRYPARVVAEGREQCLTDLHDAYLSWVGVGYWLERIVNHPPDAQSTAPMREVVEVLRPCITQVRAHQQRVWLLLCALQEELAALQQQVHQREAHT